MPQKATDIFGNNDNKSTSYKHLKPMIKYLESSGNSLRDISPQKARF